MTVSKSPEDEKREQQRMQDILVLLQHLAENEETTIKLIIECLYDVGAVNFINRKVQNPAINQFTKNVASLSKPIAKRYGLYWFKKNCPELIVNWLRRKVAFPPPQQAPPPTVEVEAQPNIIKAVAVAEAQAEQSEAAEAQVEQEQSEIVNASIPIEEEGATQPISPTFAKATAVETPVDSKTLSPKSSAPVLNTQQEPTEPSLPFSTHVAVEGVDPLSKPHSDLVQEMGQIQRLRGQVQALVALWVGTVVASGVVVWHLQTTQQNALQSQPPLPSSVVQSD